MAETKPRKRASVTEQAGDAREELKRALERDTAVQGERTGSASAPSPSPQRPDRSPPAARRARPGKTPAR